MDTYVYAFNEELETYGIAVLDDDGVSQFLNDYDVPDDVWASFM